MLVVENLTKAFGSAKALDGINLSVERGQFVGVIGRSGAGKSTLLRSLNRFAEPSAGRVLWDGQDVTALTGRALRDWRRRCAMIFQQFNLIGRLDVLDNVLMGRLTHTPFWRSTTKLWSREDRLIGMAALEQMGIGALASQRADHLSGGQQQRVAICRALLQEPEIVLADEPTAELDPETRELVVSMLIEQARRGAIVVIATHDPEVAQRCDRRLHLVDGRVAELSETAATSSRS